MTPPVELWTVVTLVCAVAVTAAVDGSRWWVALYYATPRGPGVGAVGEDTGASSGPPENGGLYDPRRIILRDARAYTLPRGSWKSYIT